jgi:uncharacterized protein (TIGR02597 family)
MACLLSFSFKARTQAGAGETSAVVGVHRITLESGANFISVPFHQKPTFRGAVLSTTTDQIEVEGNPGWTGDQFGLRDGMHQYVVLVSRDISASPGVQGDWWHIVDNDTDTLTVDPGLDDLSAHLETGDKLEIRRLNSLKDVFGAGSDFLLHKDSDFDILATQEDIIRFVVGTTFSNVIFYHDGTYDTEGYYLNGTLVGTGDGSTITLNPDQPFMVFRKTGSPPLDLLLKGQVQTIPLTHYLAPGANAVGCIFPVDAGIGASNLKESGWISDTDFDVLVTQEDIGRSVIGTSFADDFFHYAGPDDLNGWYINGQLNNSYPFEPTRGYVLFIKGPDYLVWRQAVPFTP